MPCPCSPLPRPSSIASPEWYDMLPCARCRRRSAAVCFHPAHHLLAIYDPVGTNVETFFSSHQQQQLFYTKAHKVSFLASFFGTFSRPATKQTFLPATNRHSTEQHPAAVRLRYFHYLLLSISGPHFLNVNNPETPYFFSFLFFSKSRSHQSKWVAVATTKKLPFRIPEDLRSNTFSIATGPTSPIITYKHTRKISYLNINNQQHQATMFTMQQQRGGDDGRGGYN